MYKTIENYKRTRLHDVVLELGRHALEQLSGNTGDLVLVRASLERGEHRVVDLRGEVTLVLRSVKLSQGPKAIKRLNKKRKGYHLPANKRISRISSPTKTTQQQKTYFNTSENTYEPQLLGTGPEQIGAMCTKYTQVYFPCHYSIRYYSCGMCSR